MTVTQTKGELERLTLQREQDQARHEQEILVHNRRINELERNCKYLLEQESELKKESSDKEAAWRQQREQLEAKLSTQNTQLAACRLAADAAETELKQLRIMLRRIEDDASRSREVAEQEADLLRQRLALAEEVNRSQSQQLEDLRASLAEIREMKPAEHTLSSTPSDMLKVEALERECRALRVENGDLRSIMRNNEILADQLHTANLKLQRMSRLEAEQEANLAELETLKLRLKEYDQLGKAHPNLLREHAERGLEIIRLREELAEFKSK